MKMFNLLKAANKKFLFNSFRNFSTNVPSLNTSANVQPWVELENKLENTRGHLVLSEHDQIDKYILSVFKGYFRTTYKDGLTLESNIEDHGLDSLDAIEISMILEDELGYIIEAETMPKFTKVKHFVNYIKHMEAYKKEHLLLPQMKAHQADETWDDWIPKGEKIRAKLRSFVKKDGKKQEGAGAAKAEEEHKEKH